MTTLLGVYPYKGSTLVSLGGCTIATVCLHCAQAAQDELCTTKGRADYPSHSQPISMKNLNLSELDMIAWNIADASRRLAELVADRAVSGSSEIPEDLLRAFHDAKQLKAVIDRLKTSTTNTLMQEVHS